MDETKAADKKQPGTVFCGDCSHWVEPDTRQGASMLAGTVVVVQRCPGCDALLRTGDPSLISR